MIYIDILSDSITTGKEIYDTMKILIDEGELVSMYPEMLTRDYTYLNDFKEEFFEIVNYLISRKRLSKSFWKVHKDKVETIKVHRDKISSELYSFLEERGLAIEDEQNTDWILMEQNTALLYISLLAKYLAELNRDYTIPGTDYPEYEQIVYSARNPNLSFIAYNIRFTNVLPAPDPNTSIEKNFKV